MATNVFIVNMTEWQPWLAGQPYGSTVVKTVKEWCLAESADLCFNLGMFNMTGVNKNKGITYVHTPHGDLGYGGDSDTLTFGGYACKGYSNGIVNGVVKINRPINGTRTRCGIGITVKGDLIIAQTSHKATEPAFCNEVNTFVKKNSQAVRLFVLEDGGGSTSEYSALSRLNFAPEQGRPVTTVVCLKRKITPTIYRPLYQGCKGDDVKQLQIALGGISCDGDFGSGTLARVKAMQAAYNFPAKLQCGIASAYTLGRLGFNIDF